MNKYVGYFAAIVTLLLVVVVSLYVGERKALKTAQMNQDALLGKMLTDSAKHVSEVSSLTLKVRDFERFRAEDARVIEGLKIRLKDVQNVTKVVTETKIEYVTQVRDSIVYKDTLKCFNHVSPYFSSWGCFDSKIFRGGVEVIDTVYTIKRNIPHKFLFFKWGTKDVKLTQKNANPYVSVVFLENISIE